MRPDVVVWIMTACGCDGVPRVENDNGTPMGWTRRDEEESGPERIRYGSVLRGFKEAFSEHDGLLCDVCTV